MELIVDVDPKRFVCMSYGSGLEKVLIPFAFASDSPAFVLHFFSGLIEHTVICIAASICVL